MESLVDRLPKVAGPIVQIDVEQRLDRNVHRYVHHFRMNVPLFTILPIREHTLGESDHGLPILDNPLAMKSRLDHARLTPPLFPFAGNQSVAEQLVQDAVALVAFDEQAIGVAEHMLDIFRAGDHDRIPIFLDAQPKHFTVVVRALRQKAKKIVAYNEQIAEEREPYGAWRK
jgi:hypothetical protein